MEELKLKYFTEILYNNADSSPSLGFFFPFVFKIMAAAFWRSEAAFHQLGFSFSRSAKGCFELLKEMRFH